MIWRFGEYCFDLSSRGLIVGIVNATPDSFSDGGAFPDPKTACAHGLKLLEEGADILDIGGESTRPGARPVSETEEIRRVIPIIAALRHQTSAPLSIDTSKAGVAEAALKAGANIINDVTALRDPFMGLLAAARGAGLILMHMQGSPETMQQSPCYPDGDIVGEVSKFLSERRNAALGFGVHSEAIILDPGIGFGKTVTHNLAVLAGIPVLSGLGAPLMIGHSRKSVLGAAAGSADSTGRLAAGIAITGLARESGALLFRVHDPAPHREALRMTESIMGARQGGAVTS